MPTRRTIGSITVTALADGEGPFFQPREEAFPDATAEHWRAADERDPAAVTDDGRWWLQFRCFALRAGDGPVTLVDAGIGPAGSPAASWAPVPGRLPAELAAAGIDPADVRTVVLTHLHTDHVGWAVTGTAGTPWFGNADYLVQRAELDALGSVNPELGAGLIAPLRAAGQLRVLDGDTPLTPGVRVLSTPGHTPVTSRCWWTQATSGYWSPATCWCTRSSSSTPTWRTPTTTSPQRRATPAQPCCKPCSLTLHTPNHPGHPTPGPPLRGPTPALLTALPTFPR